jgi:hypothetical protein
VDDPTQQHLQAALRETSNYYSGGQLLIGAVGLFVIIGGLIREIYWLSLIALVFFGGLVGLMAYSHRRMRNHPLRRIIFEHPERITNITYRMATSSSGALATHWLMFSDDTELSLGLRFDEAVLHALAPFLARRFVNANIQIPGFDPEHDIARM